MSTSISSAAMIVNLNGLFGTLDPEMEQFESKLGIKSLIEIYTALFSIPENTNHYSEKDYRAAERKFLKYAPERGGIEFNGQPLKE